MITTSLKQESSTLAFWEKAEVEIQRLKNRGVRRIFNGTPNIEQAFVLKNRCIVCGDEGITEGIHLPGSGVLLDRNARHKYIREAGITEFTTHENCGAFRMVFPNELNPNQAAQQWGQIEAQALGLPYRFITHQELQRPVGFHNAVAAYYDGTGLFNRISGLPPGFVISRKYFPDAQLDLRRYLSIVFGEGGFGDKFSSHFSFSIIVLVNPEFTLQSEKVLQEEVQMEASLFKNRVQVYTVRTNWFLRSLKLAVNV